MGYKNYNNRLFKILDKYHTLIFQHLTLKEILLLAEVESSIDKTIQSCAHCMSRVFISLEGNKPELHSRLQVLAKSKRNYRNIRINCGNFRELSRQTVLVLHCYFSSLTVLVVTHFNVKDSYFSDFSLPRLRYLKISFSTLTALSLLMRASQDHQVIRIENMDVLHERHYVENVMSYRNVRLLNSSIKGLNCLDFMYNNCIDFQLEADRKDDIDDLIELLMNVVNPDEITVTIKDSVGFRFVVHRLNQNFVSGSDSVQIYSRRVRVGHFDQDKRRKLIPRPQLFSENFLVSLEVEELTFTLLKRLGRAMTHLRSLRIFDITAAEKRLLFEHFPSLEMIVTPAADDMESEVFATRSMFEIKKSRDPLKIFDRAMVELILQHLETDELFNATEVSSKWNQVIGECSEFNRRIVLRLNCRNFDENDHEMVLRSRKTFENIEIDGDNQKALAPHILDIIHMFSACLKELDLRNIKTFEKKPMRPLVFKRLRALRLYNVEQRFSDNVFEHLTSLEEMVFDCVSFRESHFDYLKNIPNLHTFRAIDTHFDNYSSSFSHSQEVEMKELRRLEISFYSANSWSRVESQGGLENFIKKTNQFNVREAKLCGIRGKILQMLLSSLHRVERLELVNIWQSELEKLNQLPMKVDIYTQNHHFLQDLNWRKTFRGLRTLHVGKLFPDTGLSAATQADRDFKRLMKTNWRKMAYEFNSSARPGSHDPLMRLPEDIHDLIFQHIGIMEFRNCLEVSPTWSFYTRNSRVASSRVCLKFTKDNIKDREQLLATTNIKCQSVALFGNYIKYLGNFMEFLRDLTVYTNEYGSPTHTFDFPCLESLTVRRQYEHQENQSMHMVLQHFERCKTLKLLALHERFSEESVAPLLTVLRNNPGLKDLQVYNCPCYRELFKTDFSVDIAFRLESLAFDIGQDSRLQRNTAPESHFINFLALHAETLRVLRMHVVTGRIMNEVFSRFRKVETFYSSKGSDFEDFRSAEPCPSLVSLALPRDFAATSLAVEFVNRAVNCEHLYVHTLALDLLREIIVKMRNLRLLSFVEERDNCTKNYGMLVADNDRQLNSGIQFKKLSSTAITLENLHYEKLFNSRW